MSDSAYFNHEYASNSDLKRLMSKFIEGEVERDDLEVIFDQGTLNHHALLEPHKADRSNKDYDLACEMAKTVLKDEMCRKIIMASDFRREHEFYNRDVYGIKGRCKTDGDTKKFGVIFEYKGLSLTTERALDEAIEHFHYDQGSCWYLNTTNYKFHQYRYHLTAAVSKKDPGKLFKRLVDRDSKIYTRGHVKCLRATEIWKNMLL
jgi:PDDEXK-like domain of unknown function (DUF3799)